jgi:hypothetical protein
MNIAGFEQLSTDEFSDLLLAPVQIVALIGASDGHFDEMEEYWAAKLVQAKTIGKAEFLRPYWSLVHFDFREKVDEMLSKLPDNVQFRNQMLSESLSKLNDILPKLEANVAGHLYKGFLDLAEETAVASGGFMRLGAVNNSERAYIDLPMLKPLDIPALPKDAWQKEDDEKEKARAE